MTAFIPGQAGDRKPAAQQAASAPEAIRPQCQHCRTDSFLIYEEYVPLRINPRTRHVSAASASYVCSRCGEVGGHDVPGDWTPPGWHWYS